MTKSLTIAVLAFAIGAAGARAQSVALEQAYDLCMQNRAWSQPRDPVTGNFPWLIAGCDTIATRMWSAPAWGIKRYARIRSQGQTQDQQAIAAYLAANP